MTRRNTCGCSITSLQQNIPTICGVNLYCTTGGYAFLTKGIIWPELGEFLFTGFLRRGCIFRKGLFFLLDGPLIHVGPMVSVWMYPHTLHNVKRGRFGASGTLSILESRGGCLRGQCTPLMVINFTEFIDNSRKMTNN